MPHLVRILLVLIPLTFVGGGVAWADMWKENGGDCSKTAFSEPAEAPLASLKKCVRLFEAYRAVASVKKSEKKQVIAAMTRLYTEGSDLDAHIARIGLSRLGQTVAPRSGSVSSSDTTVSDVGQTERVKCSHPAPSGADKKKAERAFKKGFKLYRKKKYEGALAKFETMMEIAPGWAKSLRNAAGLNALTGNTDRSLELLQCLKDLGTENHITQLKKTRSDEDFASLRDNSSFKEITGYARIVLVDTLKEERGEENLDNIEEILNKLNYKKVERKEASKEQTKPTIFYQLHSKVPAYLISKMIEHPSLAVAVMPDKYKEKNFDIVVLWGDRYKPGEDPKTRVPSIDDADDLLNDISRKENEILSKPDKFERKLDKALNAPDKLGNKVNNLGNKTEKIINKPGETVDKIKKIGDKLRNPF
jgi:hypothetical protein